MPFESEAQRRYMYAKHPEIAKRWEKHTKDKDLPEKKKENKKEGKDMPSFTSQDRPEGVKDVYRALKREHPDMPEEVKARVAARQGKPGKQHQGPPYKAPLNKEYKKKQKKEGGLARLGRLTAAAKKKGVTPRQLGGKTPQQAGITDPKTVNLAKKVKSQGLKQRASETRRGGLVEMEEKRRKYRRKGKVAMNEDQRIDAILGDLDPIEEVVLKSEDEKIADILEKDAAGLRRFTRQLEGISKRQARGAPTKKLTEDAARTYQKVKHKGKGRVGVSGERGTQEAYKKIKRLEKKSAEEEEETIKKEGLGADMAGEGGAAGGPPPAAAAAMGGMPGPAATDVAAPVEEMQDPIDAENEQLKKMIENMKLKQELKELNTAVTGVSGEASGDMVGMPPAPDAVKEDPMEAMRDTLTE